jgi:3-oxoacyl-[acyl-carrier-protein] synthase-3|tara:strand:+ start:670 stop:1629 length:960 start_codon:yes stop_codon:yes gene_type:complete
MLNIKITDSGYYLPSKIETSDELASKIGKSKDWIISRTGVQERRISDIDVDKMAAIACKNAIGNGTPPDLIINASGVPKQTIPDTSVFIQKELGYSGIPSFSIHSTCLSFLTAFHTASSLIEAKQYKKILIVSSDRGSIGRNFSEPESSALLGDASAAIIIEPSNHAKLIDYKMETYPEGALFTQVKGGGTYRHPDNPQTIDKDHYFTMSGPQVYKMARKKVYSMIGNILSKNNLSIKDINLVIPHQASGTAIKAYSKFGGFNEQKVMNIIHKYGNCVSASIPLALCIAIEEHKINDGDLVMMVGTGAGLSVASSIFKF